jgi:hypothetical protein
MSTTTNLSEIFRGILTRPTRGVVGLVDEVLTVCQEQGLALEWEPGSFRVHSQLGWEELTGVRLRKSVFRAILARIASLCNECSPDSAPYGGQGRFSIGAAAFKVKFVNTGEEQTLELAVQASAR